jgi:hypothetical protein
MPDSWVEKFEREVYERAHFQQNETSCSPPTQTGVLQCPRPVVRHGRCLLHTPKLTYSEKASLSSEDAAYEKQLEDEFREALHEYVRQSPQGFVDLQAIHFPEMHWNQGAWRDVLRDRTY